MLDRTSAAEYLCIGVMGPVSIKITFKLRTGAEENLFLSLPGFPQVVLFKDICTINCSKKE